MDVLQRFGTNVAPSEVLDVDPSNVEPTIEAGDWSWVMPARNLVLVAIFAALALDLAARTRARRSTMPS
jgi:hypothetical protein